MARIPIALQLYSIRRDCERDLPGTLKKVADMGYEGVEFAGFYGYSAPELRRILDDVGLPCVGSHTRFADLQGDALQETVAYNQILGNRFLICPGLPEERRNSRAAWLQTARLFDLIAARLDADDMVTGYHNHFVEFAPLEGELPWDTFFKNTRQDVFMQIDTGNAIHGGGDPTACLRDYPGRAVTVHLKEYSTTNEKAIIGEGDTDWETIFRLCETVGGTEWYIVEQESYAYPPLECVQRCLAALKEMGK